MKLLLATCLLFIACNSDDADPPSCQAGVAAYYDSGCGFTDLDGNTIPQGDVVALCRDTLQVQSCDDELNAWLECLESTDDCDCSREQEALIDC